MSTLTSDKVDIFLLLCYICLESEGIGMRTKKIKAMSLTALSASFIVLCSWITVPFSVPFTMQTFAVFLVLLSFGGKIGSMSVLLYLTLGTFGVPVFSSFGAGPSALLGPSGGFLWGFWAITIVYLCLERFFVKKPFLRLLTLLLGLSLCYSLGAWYFYITVSSGSFGFANALLVCVVPYIIPDVLKLFLAFALHKKLKSFIKA
jgi:biotin transport system substrate-specific component